MLPRAWRRCWRKAVKERTVLLTLELATDVRLVDLRRVRSVLLAVPGDRNEPDRQLAATRAGALMRFFRRLDSVAVDVFRSRASVIPEPKKTGRPRKKKGRKG